MRYYLNVVFILLIATNSSWDLLCSAEIIQTIAFGSCNEPERVSIWNQLSNFNPDRIMLLGDNMYADHKPPFLSSSFIAANPADLKAQYKLLTEDQTFSDMIEKVGGWDNVAATFDDHDYGHNNGDRSYPHRKQSQELFWDFSQTPTDSLVRKQAGVYSSKVFSVSIDSPPDEEGNIKGSNSSETNTNSNFRYKIVMLDTRSNKGVMDSMFQMGDGTNDLLGEEQWIWLESELADSNVDFVLIGSSIQVLPTDKLTEELWGDYPVARMRLLSLIIRSKANNVVILSGDVHYAEVSKAHCTWTQRQKGVQSTENITTKASETLWELTSSGLTHTFTKHSPLKDVTGLLASDKGRLIGR
jgi:alkaline phosphatase D